MSMEFNFYDVQVGNRQGLPVPGIELWGKLATQSERPIVILASHCNIRALPSRQGKQIVPVATNVPFRTGDAAIAKDSYATASVRVPLPFATLKAIELMRQGTSGLFLHLELLFMGVPLIAAGDRGNWLGTPDSVRMKVEGRDDYPMGFEFSRDEWLETIKAIGFADIEVFELPTFTHPALPEMRKAIEALRGAEQAMGLGDWSGVMSKTRGAFEAVATFAGKTKDLKAGFDKFWKAAFPGDAEADLRDALDKIVESLAKFQHLGRHAKHPFPEIERPEALLALRHTLALFEYVGERMKRNVA